MLKRQYENIFKNQDNHWWYKGMRAINESLLKKYLPENKPLKILDAGCGPGAALVYLSKFGDVVGVDISDDALKFAKKRGKVVKGDVSDLPFKDETFDVVVCLDVLYHKWVDLKKALSELKRVLKPGGVLLIREPAFDWFKSSEDIASATKHRFTKNEVKGEFDNSFVIKKITYVNFFLFPFALIKRIPEVVGFKKKRGVSDVQAASPFLNKILLFIFQKEQSLINYVNFPFGTSVICVAQKKYDKKN
ncbi:MAG: hypothetical protein A2687_01740 [Candidatus Levybacteria bacterium RIFCSPHIGHO2_01_FULL_38_26]|nr:MAG: hypothetical protein A2687_01740 [Candidatus Levybacteria bacterium RIFCSPHIGHO2_01_FULL_38_26]